MFSSIINIFVTFWSQHPESEITPVELAINYAQHSECVFFFLSIISLRIGLLTKEEIISSI